MRGAFETLKAHEALVQAPPVWQSAASSLSDWWSDHIHCSRQWQNWICASSSFRSPSTNYFYLGKSNILTKLMIEQRVINWRAGTYWRLKCFKGWDGINKNYIKDLLHCCMTVTRHHRTRKKMSGPNKSFGCTKPWQTWVQLIPHCKSPLNHLAHRITGRRHLSPELHRIEQMITFLW